MCEKLHTYKYLHRKCCERGVIVAAWKKLRKGKTTRREVIKIEADFDYYVDKMQTMIRNTRPGGDPDLQFWPEKHKARTVFEHGKEREIFCPTIWEQWVHHIVIQVLPPDRHTVRLQVQLRIHAEARRSIWQAPHGAADREGLPVFCKVGHPALFQECPPGHRGRYAGGADLRRVVHLSHPEDLLAVPAELAAGVLSQPVARELRPVEARPPDHRDRDRAHPLRGRPGAGRKQQKSTPQSRRSDTPGAREDPAPAEAQLPDLPLHLQEEDGRADRQADRLHGLRLQARPDCPA